MVNEKFIYAKLLLLKIKKHPLFDINKKISLAIPG